MRIFLKIPTAWTSLVGHEDPSLETNVIRAYHRHMEDFCAGHPGRLTSMIVASARDVEAAVKEVRDWGKSRWAVAVMPLVTKDIPADHPDLEPIWRACVEHDLPIAASTALPGRRPISRAASTCGTTSSSAGSPRTPGVPCALSPR